jgi:hypothetical protein
VPVVAPQEALTTIYNPVNTNENRKSAGRHTEALVDSKSSVRVSVTLLKGANVNVSRNTLAAGGMLPPQEHLDCQTAALLTQRQTEQPEQTLGASRRRARLRHKKRMASMVGIGLGTRQA